MDWKNKEIRQVKIHHRYDHNSHILNISWARIWEYLPMCVSQILWGSLKTSKMVGFGWNIAHLFLWWILGCFFHFSKILIFGAWGRVFAKRNVCYYYCPFFGFVNTNGLSLIKFLGIFISMSTYSLSCWTLSSKVSLMFCYQMLQK